MTVTFFPEFFRLFFVFKCSWTRPSYTCSVFLFFVTVPPKPFLDLPRFWFLMFLDFNGPLYLKALRLVVPRRVAILLVFVHVNASTSDLSRVSYGTPNSLFLPGSGPVAPEFTKIFRWVPVLQRAESDVWPSFGFQITIFLECSLFIGWFFYGPSCPTAASSVFVPNFCSFCFWGSTLLRCFPTMIFF